MRTCGPCHEYTMAVACMDASCCCHCRCQCFKLLERQQGGWTRPGADDPAPFTVHLQLDRVALGSDHCHQLWMQHCSAMDGHMCSNSAQLRLLLHKALEFAGGQHAAGRQAGMHGRGRKRVRGRHRAMASGARSSSGPAATVPCAPMRSSSSTPAEMVDRGEREMEGSTSSSVIDQLPARQVQPKIPFRFAR